MEKYDYDLIIIGGGGGGITASIFAAGLGKKVAMLDKKKFGGECTWSGCVPSKALLQSAKVSSIINNADKYGLSFSKKPVLKYDNVMKNVRKVIDRVYSGEKPDHFEEYGIKAIENVKVRFIDSHAVEVNGEKISSKIFLISTGSSPLVPPVEGLKDSKYFTNEDIFSLNKLPKSMIVMGGGPIGVELALAFNRLGVKVTLIEMAPAILIREDPELTEILVKIMLSEGITILTGAMLKKVSGKSKIDIEYEIDGKKKKLSSDSILVAAGRRPNVEGLELENAGINYDRKGITVDSKLRTSIGNIYAAGDVVGPYQFSHMANYQAIVAITNAFLPISKSVNYNHVPWCTFTDPELARSGLTEKEALNSYGKSIKIFRSYYSDIDRGKTDRSETGIAKVVCNKKGQIIGIHILGERAGEMMQELHLAKSLGIPLYKLDSVIHCYPLYTDLIKSLARQAYIDKIQSNVFVKIFKSIKGKK